MRNADDLWLELDDRGAELGAGGPHMTALVIDDSRFNREYYEAVLEQIGWSVVTAEDGREGVDLFASVRPVVAVVDVRLPDTNGYQVVRQLRTLASHPTQIVLMSADPSMLDHERARLAGADIALVGPLGITQLRSLLDSRVDWADPGVDRDVYVSATCSLQFIGSCRVWDGRTWQDLVDPVLRHTLAALVASYPVALPEEELMRIAANATPSLNVTAIGPQIAEGLGALGCSDAIAPSGNGFRLALPPDNVDTLRFESRTRRLVQAELPTVEVIAMAGALLDDASLEAYPQIDSPLVDAARARLYELRAGLEEALAIHLVIQDALTEAILTLRRLTARELWREGSWSLLMIALYRQGRPEEALQTYQRVQDLLIRTVGVDPSPLLKATAAMILARDPRLDGNDLLRHHVSDINGMFGSSTS